MEENQNGVQLWDGKNSNSASPLRRPNSSLPCWSPGNLSHIDVSKSTLSPNAAEWYPTPRCAPEPPKITSVQNRLRNIHLGSDNRENHQTQGDQQYLTQKFENDPTEDTTKLKEIIYQLTYDPGQFDRVFETFIDIIKPYSEDLEVCNTVADMLFDSALVQSNFRYNAARLCSCVQDVCPLVRSRLHILCEKELAGHREKQQGFTMFLAELYTQLHYENLYGKSLLNALRNLLSSGEAADIKCLCQALKLAGHSLDLYDKTAMDDIFSQMQSVRTSLPQNITNLLDSVISLRSRQWDHATSASSSNNQTTNRSATYEDECAVLLSPEESDFFYEHMLDADELYDPEPEMDEEIQEAFKEFVQLSKR